MNAVRSPWLALSQFAPLLLFAIVFAVFGAKSARFVEPGNLLNILVQASSTVVVATGMTFVLLTAGVDLSVGAIMFVAAAITGKLALAGYPMPLTLTAMLGAGIVFGAVNALIVTRLRIIAFVVTLATLFIGRGFALWLTGTRAMNLPDNFLQLGSIRVAGVPLTVALAGAVVLMAQLVLSLTPYGRQIYAVGHSVDKARKAGLRVRWMIGSVYVISGACAALGAIITLTQLGAVSPKFGENREFGAIAAAVLGGTSLFGGRGRVFPGTVLGVLLIQCVENGLVLINADPYLYPLVTSAVIFVAVLLDSGRQRLVEQLTRRRIRFEG